MSDPLRPPNLGNSVQQNVDEYLREMYSAIVQLQGQINSLISQVQALDARVKALGG
jgi:hypothetical protein